MSDTMRRPSIAAGALLGSLTILPLIAIWYAGAQWADLPFLPADVARELSRLGWGGWQSAAASWGLVVGAGCLIGILAAWWLRQSGFAGATVGLAVGAVAFVPAALVEYLGQASTGSSLLVSLLWLGVLILNWGIALALWLERPALNPLSAGQPGPAQSRTRRDLLRLTAGSFAAAIAASGAGVLAGPLRRPAAAVPPAALAPAASSPGIAVGLPVPSPSATAPANVEPQPAELAANCALAPVVRPTPYPHNIQFGDLDPSTGLHVTGEGKVLDAATYHLDVVGKVDKPLRFTYDDLRCLPKIGGSVTVVCVGYFEDTAGWSGADLKALLQMAGVRRDAQSLRLTGADDYGHDILLSTALEGDNFLAYELEGAPLPILHGFPVRAMFPSLNGNNDVKWLVKIDVY